MKTSEKVAVTIAIAELVVVGVASLAIWSKMRKTQKESIFFGKKEEAK